MFEVYLGIELVFEGNKKEVDAYCKSHDWDMVLDKMMVDLEKMIADGYGFDSFFDHFDYN